MPETEVTIWTALAAAKAEFPGLTKTAANPFFKSHYVPLEQVLDVIEPILAKYQLILIQEPTNVQSATGTRPALRTTLIYVPLGTERWSEMLVLPAKEDPQGQGAALTYARRYAIIAFLGLNIEKDDDGETAQGRGAGPKASATPLTTAPPPFAPTEQISGSPNLLEDQVEKVLKSRKPSAKATAIQLRNEEWAKVHEAADDAAAEAVGAATPSQKRLLFALLRGHDLDTPEKQHQFYTDVAGRPIYSYTDLTGQEISGCITLLKAS